MWTKRALGQDPRWSPPFIDVPMLEAPAIWSALLVVALALASDLAVSALDPRTPRDCARRLLSVSRGALSTFPRTRVAGRVTAPSPRPPPPRSR